MPRGPLPWLLALEAVVLVALAFCGWRLATDRLGPPPSRPPAATARLPQATPKPSARPSAVPPVPAPTPSAPGVGGRTNGPALSFDPLFWRQHLTQVNRDQSAWAALEWRLVQAVEAFARAYVDAVVVPAVQNAGRGSAA